MSRPVDLQQGLPPRAPVASGQAPARGSARSESRHWIGPGALRLLCLVLVLLAWEFAPRLGWVPPVMLAPLSATLAAGVAHSGMFASNVGYTLFEMALALALMIVVGGLAGLVLGSVRVLRETLLPLVSSVYAVPLVILYPVLTAWIGIGPESKIAFGAIYGIFPMLLATAAGVQTVDRQFLLAARSMGATRSQQIRHVILPAAVPSVISGMRLGCAMTAIGVVIAEMMAATAGIGFVITQNRTMFQTANVYFGVLLVLVLAALLDLLLNRLQKLASHWYPNPKT